MRTLKYYYSEALTNKKPRRRIDNITKEIVFGKDAVESEEIKCQKLNTIKAVKKYMNSDNFDKLVVFAPNRKWWRSKEYREIIANLSDDEKYINVIFEEVTRSDF